jgi:hypothetical protein
MDPLRDVDWILISGASLRDLSRDAITVHFGVPDDVVDDAIHRAVGNYQPNGPFDAGVSGVPALLAGDHVVVRPQPHVVVIVPERRAEAVAKQLLKAKEMPRDIIPDVALFLRVLDPHRALPGLVPEGVAELRVRVTVGREGGAGIAVEGDCMDEAVAAHDGAELLRALRGINTFAVSLATRGLLTDPQLSGAGKSFRIEVRATPEQVKATIESLQVVSHTASGSPDVTDAGVALDVEGGAR